MLKSIKALSLAAMAIITPIIATADELPDYVIAEFGAPPAVPDGPLPESLAAAVQTVFHDTL